MKKFLFAACIFTFSLYAIPATSHAYENDKKECELYAMGCNPYGKEAEKERKREEEADRAYKQTNKKGKASGYDNLWQKKDKNKSLTDIMGEQLKPN